MCARLELVTFDMAETSLLSHSREIHVGLDEVADFKSVSFVKCTSTGDPWGRRFVLQKLGYRTFHYAQTHTTRFTYNFQVIWLAVFSENVAALFLGRETHLKEPLQPPDLEYPLPNQHPQLKDTPPLHSCIRALRRIPMRAFSDHYVRLLVFDLRKEVGEGFHCVPVISKTYCGTCSPFCVSCFPSGPNSAVFYDRIR